MSQPHECRRATGCHCRIDALEPADDCPVHGWPDNRCETCGRFLPRHEYVVQVAIPVKQPSQMVVFKTEPR